MYQCVAKPFREIFNANNARKHLLPVTIKDSTAADFAQCLVAPCTPTHIEHTSVYRRRFVYGNGLPNLKEMTPAGFSPEPNTHGVMVLSDLLKVTREPTAFHGLKRTGKFPKDCMFAIVATIHPVFDPHTYFLGLIKTT